MVISSLGCADEVEEWEGEFIYEVIKLDSRHHNIIHRLKRPVSYNTGRTQRNSYSMITSKYDSR